MPPKSKKSGERGRSPVAAASAKDGDSPVRRSTRSSTRSVSKNPENLLEQPRAEPSPTRPTRATTRQPKLEPQLRNPSPTRRTIRGRSTSQDSTSHLALANGRAPLPPVQEMQGPPPMESPSKAVRLRSPSSEVSPVQPAPKRRIVIPRPSPPEKALPPAQSEVAQETFVQEQSSEQDSEDDQDATIAKPDVFILEQCPYLDSVHRQNLDFDFEKVCSVSLSNLNVYACLVCGKYFQGRGKTSHAYFHSMSEGHHVYINLTTLKVYCLPDGYEVVERSLSDIQRVINPVYTREQVALLDKQHRVSFDLQNKKYLPGFVGLNNIKHNDYINVVLQALVHVPRIRDYFLLKDASQLTTELVRRFGLLVRKMWNPRSFKGQVSPHELLQEVVAASQKRFTLMKQGDAHEFLAWFLNTLHRDLGGRKTGKSVIMDAFQGEVTIQSRPMDGPEDAPIESKTVPFLFLSFELPPIPLFLDEQEKNIIPQVPLGMLLTKFDGVSRHETNGQIRTYKLHRLPRYLIFQHKRFEKNNFTIEKNPTIINFPTRNVDVHSLVKGAPMGQPIFYDLVANICHVGAKKVNVEVAAETQSLSINASASTSASTMLSGTTAASTAVSSNGPAVRNTIANIEGAYKVHVMDKSTEQWYQIQDLLVEETIPQMIFLAETYIQIWERQQ